MILSGRNKNSSCSCSLFASISHSLFPDWRLTLSPLFYLFFIYFCLGCDKRGVRCLCLENVQERTQTVRLLYLSSFPHYYWCIQLFSQFYNWIPFVVPVSILIKKSYFYLIFYLINLIFYLIFYHFFHFYHRLQSNLALDGIVATDLGQMVGSLTSDNELWLAMVLRRESVQNLTAAVWICLFLNPV